MIDLHLHTTASDGRSTPDELVSEVVAAGIRVMAATDHDTVAAVPAVKAAARAAGINCIAGIEMTAVHARKDIHILGYFVDVADPELAAFLDTQRADRRRRVMEIAARLEGLGAPIDTAPLLEAGRQGGRALGRPAVAAALINAGHARDISDAFDRYLSEGRPAYVVRQGAPPAEVIERIHRAGGVASLAHAGKYGLDEIIPGLVDHGLRAIEVFHPDHGAADVARYQHIAARFSLFVTGGSDYHGPGSGRAAALGHVGVPAADYAALAEFAATRRSR